MKRSFLTFASAAVGGLMLLCNPQPARAQSAPSSQLVGLLASVAPGSIAGIVLDEQGAPIPGAMVSAFGATPSFAVTDRTGHFTMQTLSPGPYLVSAHVSGFIASRGQIVEVRPSVRSSSSIALHRSASAATAGKPPVLAAGVGTPADAEPKADGPEIDTAAADGDDDSHAETAWRLRHARRSVLRDATVPEQWLDDNSEGGSFLARAVATSGRAAADLFNVSALSGQFNLLTAGSFDAPLELFGNDTFASSVANVSVGSAAGASADWAVRGAVSQGRIASWVVAGSYVTRAPARHQYDIGLSYAAQRYDASNPALLMAVTTTRDGGTVSAYDTFAATEEVSITYGARYGHYDYLANGDLLSPRVGVTIAPAGEPFRITALVSHQGVAPGAEEFQPPSQSALWLPSQRTFSGLTADRPLQAEWTDHFEVGYEQDLTRTTTVSVRAFRQRVNGQLVTLFGFDAITPPSGEFGHYFLADAGDELSTGWSAGLRTTVGDRLHGSVTYSQLGTNWTQGVDAADAVLLTPSTVRLASEKIHDVTAALETDIRETATRVMVLWRVSDGFARPQSDRQAVDTRFDVQLHQALPFLNFSTAQWEALFAIRNFFHDLSPDQSVYDELLVVRPPKRVVGGLTLRF